MSLYLLMQKPSPHQAQRGAHWELKLVDMDGAKVTPWRYTSDTRRIMLKVQKKIDPKARRWQDRVIIQEAFTYEQLHNALELHFPEIFSAEGK